MREASRAELVPRATSAQRARGRGQNGQALAAVQLVHVADAVQPSALHTFVQGWELLHFTLSQARSPPAEHSRQMGASPALITVSSHASVPARHCTLHEVASLHSIVIGSQAFGSLQRTTQGTPFGHFTVPPALHWALGHSISQAPPAPHRVQAEGQGPGGVTGPPSSAPPPPSAAASEPESAGAPPSGVSAPNGVQAQTAPASANQTDAERGSRRTDR